jgi:hypothetical protein
MTEATSITNALAPLISHGKVPLKSIAIIGEIITLDARLRNHDLGPRKRTTHEELGEFLEAYEEQLQRSRSAVTDFLHTQNRAVLATALSKIKEALTELY